MIGGRRGLGQRHERGSVDGREGPFEWQGLRASKSELPPPRLPDCEEQEGLQQLEHGCHPGERRRVAARRGWERLSKGDDPEGPGREYDWIYGILRDNLASPDVADAKGYYGARCRCCDTPPLRVMHRTAHLEGPGRRPLRGADCPPPSPVKPACGMENCRSRIEGERRAPGHSSAASRGPPLSWLGHGASLVLASAERPLSSPGWPPPC